MSRIICISREYGSGGHETAKRTAGLLDIPCLDKQLMECAIQTSGLPKEILEKAEEKARNPFLYTSVYAGDNLELYGMAPVKSYMSWSAATFWSRRKRETA